MFVTYDYRWSMRHERAVIRTLSWDFTKDGYWRKLDHMQASGLGSLPSECVWIVPGTVLP